MSENKKMKQEMSSQEKTYEEEIAEDDEFERLLNQFINSELEGIDTGIDEPEEEQNKTSDKETQSSAPHSSNANSPQTALDTNEKALFDAYKNFSNSIVMMASMNDLSAPEFQLTEDLLIPHYKYKTGSLIASEALIGWDVMLKIHPTELQGLHPDASDEELLDFAEHCEDELLQLAIISYVEILIEMEGCELAIEGRRLKAQRRKIEKEIYEEHQRRLERKQRYIESIQKKNFPIDAERLVTNYFRTAQKDPDGAYQVLINNPAVYAPIDTSKIKPRFFGLIKTTPQDGIRVNREIGDFLKKLKV